MSQGEPRGIETGLSGLHFIGAIAPLDFSTVPFSIALLRRFPEVKFMTELTHRANLRFVRFEAQKADKKGLHTTSE